MFWILGSLVFGFFLLFPITMIFILVPLIRTKFNISYIAAVSAVAVLFIMLIGFPLGFFIIGAGSSSIILLLAIALSLVVLFFICFVVSVFGAARKKLTVFYDLSDFILTFLSFVILRFTLSPAFFSDYEEHFLEALGSVWGFITFQRYMGADVLLILIGLFLTVALAVYSFYMSYQYNKYKRIFVVFSFFGRYVVTGAIALFPPIIIGNFGVSLFFSYPRDYFLNISPLSAAAVAFVFILILAAYIRYFRFSYFETFIYSENIKALGAGLEKMYLRSGCSGKREPGL